MNTYICIDCESAGREAIVSVTNGQCNVCKSSAVLSTTDFAKAMATLGTKAATAKAKPVVSQAKPPENKPSVPPVPESTAKAGATWDKHVAKIRVFLSRSKLDELNSWWDGYHFLTGHSWDFSSKTPAEGEYDYVCLQLINKNGSHRNLMLYFDPEDEGLTEVSGELR